LLDCLSKFRHKHGLPIANSRKIQGIQAYALKKFIQGCQSTLLESAKVIEQLVSLMEMLLFGFGLAHTPNTRDYYQVFSNNTHERSIAVA
jgi:hypothetical protein